MAADPATRRAQLVQALIARERWSRKRLLEHQRRALRELLRHAVSESPYYRESLGPAAAESEIPLEELPTLSKPTLMAEWDRVVTNPRLRLASMERHLEETPNELHLGEYRVYRTGGSTVRRGIFVHSPDEFEMVVAVGLRTLATAGGHPAMRVSAIGSPSPFHLTNQTFAAMRGERSASPRLTVTMPLVELVAALNARRPEAIVTYPTVLRLLAEEQLEGRLRIQPQLAVSTSETLTAETLERAHEAWGIEVRDGYACTEACVLASTCPAQVGMHIWEDCTILEVVDEHNRPVPPGVAGDKVLLTNLWNRTQPLIRYELEDSAVLAAGPNPTGRPFARIARVDGRSADILRLPARGGGEVAVHPILVRTSFAHFPEVRQYQLRHGEDGLVARVVLAPAAPRDILERVRSALVSALEEAGAEPPTVRVEPVEAIERVGTGAKLTLVESSSRTPEPALAR